MRRKGTTTLFPEELALLGAPRGRRLLHLQCNAGQDTLSLAKRGAQVTGVDLSDEVLQEFEDANGCALFEGMRAEGGRLFPAAGQPRVPMMFGLRARKPR